MTVSGIRDIVRKELPIYYRRLFTGVASLEILGKATEKSIEFSIETKPTGAKEITVNVLEAVDYPLLPLASALKDTIRALDREGALP